MASCHHFYNTLTCLEYLEGTAVEQQANTRGFVSLSGSVNTLLRAALQLVLAPLNLIRLVALQKVLAPLRLIR